MRKSKSNSFQNSKATNQLKAVKENFSNWRKIRKKRERIPKYLWEEAVSLHKDFSVSQIASQLRLNYERLRKKVSELPIKKPSVTRNSSKKEREPITFLDILSAVKKSLSSNSNNNTCHIDLFRSDGTLMRISFNQQDENDIYEFIKAFLASDDK